MLLKKNQQEIAQHYLESYDLTELNFNSKGSLLQIK